ncbi:helicase and polymerase-containing protein TEBICHI-like [Malania oleifera]|uniref:helicase and polymerase-containing protein TEBICHI-like n=1 Tax=Malania oleifera TaxID=397392 RepID=UPI0025ADF54A|nr:helicase and polymerase-containing protein TEBICHI-like [Malania oleifera]
MARGRTGCCLHSSLRIVNFIVNVFGVGMIVYSLWLLKMWKEGIAELPSTSSLPHPWFIYTCLGVGIVVCLSTLSGHMVANCISNSTLCFYIVSICSLLFIQIGVIVTIFFKMDWESQLTKYIDEHHEKFQSFIIFHLKMCRLIVLLVVVAQENWLLLTADYSQIELCLMAHFSNDSSLIELLSKPHGVVFIMIAARWTGKLEYTVSSHERDQTKRLVYGILYGMGTNTLAEQLDCTSDEAAEKIQSFKSSFPGVAAWLCETIASCRQKGYVMTLRGRKRFLSKIKLGNSKEKSKAQRQAVNSICQGSAANLIKIAMINIDSVIVEGVEMPNPSSALAAKFQMLKNRCRILLQLPDELVLEVDPSVIKQAGSLLQCLCM